jgi:hypothetical protein
MAYLLCSSDGRMRMEEHDIAKPVRVSQQIQKGHTYFLKASRPSQYHQPAIVFGRLPCPPVVCRTDGSAVCPAEVVDRRAEGFGDCDVIRSLGRCSLSRSLS